ncbi:Rof/RNase P-like protein [Phascolomyces articulosus]|uniref:Rof/RNase P-like protein n=1 Tax=Phascolomyces articulosus TaxID=60185 RepID=A0AAD5KIT4_9FUNG|nr:Rof/RNase P-like protein [Phascolomyces articulosus]
MNEMKVVYLDASEPITKHDPTKKRGKRLTASEKRAMQIYDIPKKGVKYELFEPLHNLWQGYMKELYSQGQSNSLQFAQKLLKADYHGAIIKVTKSSNPLLVGSTGIVIQETQNLFKIITKENKVKSIPKSKTVFQVELDCCSCSFTLYGQQLLTRAAERAAKKFKAKPTIDL